MQRVLERSKAQISTAEMKTGSGLSVVLFSILQLLLHDLVSDDLCIPMRAPAFSTEAFSLLRLGCACVHGARAAAKFGLVGSES